MASATRLPSLWRYLWSWVVGALLVVWATLLLVAWYTGHHEAEEITDGQLVAVARLWLSVDPGDTEVSVEPIAPTRAKAYVQDVAVLHWVDGQLFTDTHSLAAGLAWRAAAYLPFVLSPITVAFGLLLLYPDAVATLPLLVAAYALLAYPFVARSIGAALDQLPAHPAQVAATLGASPWRVWWRVTLPMVRPALRRGMAFAAATALGEFAVSLFLSRPEWLTLTTLIHQRLGRPGAASLDAALVLALLLMLLALAAFLLIDPPARRARARTHRTAPDHA